MAAEKLLHWGKGRLHLSPGVRHDHWHVHGLQVALMFSLTLPINLTFHKSQLYVTPTSCGQNASIPIQYDAAPTVAAFEAECT